MPAESASILAVSSVSKRFGGLLALDTAAGLMRRYGAATLEDAFLAATGRALEDGEDDDDEEAA